MGIEPWGRIATGIAELITALFILYRPTLFIGAIFGVGIMTGALLSHIIVLGIEIQQDGGQLFIYAAVVWISCMILSIMHRQQLITLLERITGKNVKGK
ncbi:hypothetical protein KACHI17_22340 [Sediminibacterium sp. KACHI17]|uniref:DoxX family protein n=2 Tax=Sediminibacterium sp. KACHI17 TaxID=1751071 RepID=A0AAT9GKZ3_9BACT